MFRVFALGLLALASATDDVKNSKRRIRSFEYPSWNYVLGDHWPSHYVWQTSPFVQDSLYFLSTPVLGKSTHIPLVTSKTPDVAAAVAAAKEATAAAALAHQRVQTAREQVLIQERIAAAKEATAQAAIQRSEALAAAANKSAGDRAASAHAAGHFISAPWASPEPAFHHWG